MSEGYVYQAILRFHVGEVYRAVRCDERCGEVRGGQASNPACPASGFVFRRILTLF